MYIFFSRLTGGTSPHYRKATPRRPRRRRQELPIPRPSPSPPPEEAVMGGWRRRGAGLLHALPSYPPPNPPKIVLFGRRFCVSGSRASSSAGLSMPLLAAGFRAAPASPSWGSVTSAHTCGRPPAVSDGVRPALAPALPWHHGTACRCPSLLGGAPRPAPAASSVCGFSGGGRLSRRWCGSAP
jgi:hypothetical protein